MRVRNLTLKKQVARLQKDNLMLSKENIDLKQKARLASHFASDVEKQTMEIFRSLRELRDAGEMIKGLSASKVGERYAPKKKAVPSSSS